MVWYWTIRVCSGGSSSQGLPGMGTVPPAEPAVARFSEERSHPTSELSASPRRVLLPVRTASAAAVDARSRLECVMNVGRG